jgi:hypothetical protein
MTRNRLVIAVAILGWILLTVVCAAAVVARGSGMVG